MKNVKNSWKKNTPINEYFSLTKHKCKCGHVMNFYTSIPYLECEYCGRLNFRNKKCEFDYKVKRKVVK